MTARRSAPIDPAALDAVLAPFGQSHMLPREAYIDEAVLAWEQDAFFRAGWVCVGRVTDLPEPGDQRARAIGGAGLLLTRDREGALHVFANACRHRGHELLPCEGSDQQSRRAVPVPRVELRARRSAATRAPIRRPELRSVGRRVASRQARGVGRMAVRERVG